MGKPFKMKGSPMQRNFGIGSPAKDYKKGYPQPGSSAVTRAGAHDPDSMVARGKETNPMMKTGSPAKDMKYAFDPEGKASRHNQKHIDTKDDNDNRDHPWGHHETVQVKHLEKHAVKKTGSPANKITLISKEKRDRLKRGVKRSFADIKDLIGGGKRGRRRKSNARKIKSRIRH